MLEPIFRLLQKQDGFPLSTRKINNVLVRRKKRQPKLVRSHQRRPPNLTSLQRQRITIQTPLIQRMGLRFP